MPRKVQHAHESVRVIARLHDFHLRQVVVARRRFLDRFVDILHRDRFLFQRVEQHGCRAAVHRGQAEGVHRSERSGRDDQQDDPQPVAVDGTPVAQEFVRLSLPIGLWRWQEHV
ncbi:MAG: hypothetical protein ABI885_28130, partial [Gammaproteobacteria bacterium]